MENKIKAYHIARKVHRQTNTLNHPQTQSYPTHNNKSIIDHQATLHNIFRDNTQLRIRKLQIQKDREYQITGAGAVLKINHIKNKKKRDAKNRNSQEKKSIVTNKSSRQSLVPCFGSIYLTKDQVLDMHSKSSSGIRSAERKNELYFPLSRQKMMESQKQNTKSNFKPKQTSNNAIKSQNFTVNKLKQRLLMYKASWDRQNSKYKQQKPKGHILKCKRMTKLSDSQRDNRQTHRMHDGMLQSTMSWALTLRQESERREQRSVLICQQNGLNIEGRSKYRKQRMWVQEKHSKGYFFYRNSINSSQIEHINRPVIM